MQIINSKIFRFVIVIAAAAVFMTAAWRLNSVPKTQFVSTSGYTYERAMVTQVITDNLQENGTRAGSQYIKVKMLSGTQKGQILDATSADGTLFGAVCAAGDKVIVTISVSGATSTVSVYSHDRMIQVFAFVGIFFVLMCAVGGKRGIKSVIALVVTCASFIYLFMPMIYSGMSPLLAAVIVSLLTTVVTMYLIGGFTVKTVAAITGTILGVLIAAISAALFGYFADINGYNVSDIETLLFVGQNTPIKIGGLLFAGILIASLGAVMDIAISISSAICEIYQASPDLSWQDLFKSGLNVGRDMMGTMSNTLILAFAGGALSILVVNYAYNLPFLQLINSYSIDIELMQGISGCIGVILAVPCGALVTALLLTRCKKKELSQKG